MYLPILICLASVTCYVVLIFECFRTESDNFLNYFYFVNISIIFTVYIKLRLRSMNICKWLFISFRILWFSPG